MILSSKRAPAFVEPASVDACSENEREPLLYEEEKKESLGGKEFTNSSDAAADEQMKNSGEDPEKNSCPQKTKSKVTQYLDHIDKFNRQMKEQGQSFSMTGLKSESNSNGSNVQGKNVPESSGISSNLGLSIPVMTDSNGSSK